ncbi:MAG TPA: AIR synthase family protein, partial [Chloroflexota bacterium]|nr:AIR synthase family protein [Chloroflexota bacterium]
LLRELVLGRLGARRPETLIGARLGVDAAAIALDGDVCVLTTDPITTASSGAGRLAVHVVCNDLAVMGAEPVGLLATLLFPPGVTSEAIAKLTQEIDATACEENVEVLGGHTEVAPGLSQPLVVMAGVGRARRDRLVTAGGARPGDALVLTRAAGLEGSHILANDLAAQLLAVPEALLEEARGYASELSVVAHARHALDLGATAMHDPTEGGVIGALWEMAEASGAGFRVLADQIPVREPTRAICAALGVDPLRVIASGALLIACPDGPAMAAALGATVIGEITASGRVLIHPEGRIENVDDLDRDELYRVLESAGGEHRPG